MRDWGRLPGVTIVLMATALVATVLLSGCVQRSNYKNSGVPLAKNRIDHIEAAKTRIALGLQYLKIGQMSNAKFNLEKALRFAPQLPAAHSAFAYYYQRVDENELAETAYLKALKFDPQDPDTLNNYGAFLCKVRQYDKAESVFLKAIKVPSYLKVAESYENAALCAMENHRYEQAKQFFTTSLEHSALRANTLVNTAALGYAMGDYLGAQKYVQRLANIGVVSPRVLLLRVLIELKLGHITQSKKYGTTLLSMYVKTPEALAYLAQKYDHTEFELLRQRYLKHQYQQQTQGAKGTVEAVSRTSSPRAKIKRKLTPSTSSASSATIASSIASTTGSATTAQNETAKARWVVRADDGKKVRPVPVDQSRSTVAENTLASSPAGVKTIDVPFHLVKTGDTLYDISVKYNIKLKRLRQWSGLDKSSVLTIGRKIYLQNNNIYHTVKSGDNLFAISVKYNILMNNLLQWNALKENARLTLGRKILIVNPKLYLP